MTSIYWLVQHVFDVPECDDWLSAAEHDVRARLWAPKRVRDWRLGRWTAKRALLWAGGQEPPGRPDLGACSRISIVATESGSPRAVEDGRESEWSLSLSHAGGCGLCTVARRPAMVGCDIETIGRRGEQFVVDYFTAAERAFVDATRDRDERSRLVTTVWSAKESAMKALGVGLRIDTREVEVDLLTGRLRASDSGRRISDEWSPLIVRSSSGSFQGWTRLRGGQVLTVVADPPPDVPVALNDRVQPWTLGPWT